MSLQHPRPPGSDFHCRQAGVAQNHLGKGDSERGRWIIANAPSGAYEITIQAAAQQSLPGSVALKVAYVGKTGQRQERIANVNQMPLGTTYANPGVNPNALRPFRGLAAINYNTMRSTSG